LAALGASTVPASAQSPAPAPERLPERLDDAAPARAVGAQLTAMGEDFSGALLVARRSRVVLTAVRGLANRERALPNTLRTRFRVGSMDKMFTGVAVMQLVQAKRLDLRAPLATWLPDYPNVDFARSVTPHHLLTHTGGAGEIFGPEFDLHHDRLRDPADYVALFGRRPAEFAPGARWEYSNYGYILLGRLIEVVSGGDYDAYVRDHVFGPAAWTAPASSRKAPTCLAAPQPMPEPRPEPSLRLKGSHGAARRPAAATPRSRTSTASFQPFTTAACWTRLTVGWRFKAGSKAYRACCSAMASRSTPGALPAMIGHNGMADGMSGDLRILGDGDVTVVALANLAPPFLAGRLAKFVAARVALA
jgi:D-alanyl-D-alanine carboxypeptidase